MKSVLPFLVTALHVEAYKINNVNHITNSNKFALDHPQNMRTYLSNKSGSVKANMLQIRYQGLENGSLEGSPGMQNGPFSMEKLVEKHTHMVIAGQATKVASAPAVPKVYKEAGKPPEDPLDQDVGNVYQYVKQGFVNETENFADDNNMTTIALIQVLLTTDKLTIAYGSQFTSSMWFWIIWASAAVFIGCCMYSAYYTMSTGDRVSKRADRQQKKEREKHQAEKDDSD